MSYRNRSGLCWLFSGSILALVLAGCGGLDSLQVLVTPDAGSGGSDQPNGGAPSGGYPSGGDSSTGDSGAAGTTTEPAGGDQGQAGATEEAGSGGEGGQAPVPDPMPGPPRVISVAPRDKSVGAPRSGAVTITFSEPLDPTTVTPASVQIKDELGAIVIGALSYADAAVTFTPAARLNLIGIYSVNVSVAVTDTTKTPMAAPFASTFTVQDGAWNKTEVSATTSTTAVDAGSPPDIASDGANRAIAVWAQFNAATSTYDINAALFNPVRGWADPVKVNTHTVRCLHPSVSMNAGGNAVVGWIEIDSASAYSVQARRLTAVTWDVDSTKVDMPTTPSTSPYVAVAITKKGDVHVAWYSDYTDAANVVYFGMYARHADPNGVWDATTPSLTFSQAGSSMSVPTLAFDALGNGFAAYQFSSGTPVKIATIVNRYTLAASGTGKWGVSATGATASDGLPLPVSIATNPVGEAVVTWVRNTASTTYDVMGSHYNKVWATPAVLSSATTAVSSTLKAAGTAVWTGSSFLTTWAQSGGTPYNVYASEYKTAWSGAVILSDGNHTSFAPTLAGDGRGNALAIWYQANDNPGTIFAPNYDVVFSRLTGASDKWSDAGHVSTGLAGYRFPRVATLGDGSAVAVWISGASTLRGGPVAGVFVDAFR